jgi:hypothetical protein
MIEPNYIRLTDELERQLMRQAIEEQFRPRPLRALRNLLGRMIQALRSPANTDGEVTNAANA